MTLLNPFKPNYPVSPGMFTGRYKELQILENQLNQTRAGNPANFLLTGERGIGKSSLLLYIKWLAEGGAPIDGRDLNFLVIDVAIDKGTTQLSLVKQIQLSLEKQLNKSEAARSFLAKAWEFLQRVEVGGSGLKPVEYSISQSELLEHFIYSLADTESRLCENGEGTTKLFGATYDGVLILVDEADNADPELDLGSFLKLTTEKLQRRGSKHIMFGIAGLDELRNVLLRSHPSSLRIFDILRLERLTDPEVSQVIDKALEEANEDEVKKVKITDEAKEKLILFSEGFPHFIQQFGFCAFAADSDRLIDNDDVALGAAEAWAKIGERYYRNDFYDKIRKDSYRQVLRIMADDLDGWVTKKKIRESFKGGATTLDNAIRALLDRGIIVPKEGSRGVYRLQHKAFAVWIRYFTSYDYEEKG